jgi:hypothetical protein
MKKILVLNFAILTILFHSGCSKDILQAPPAAQVNLDELYQSAITDAIVAESSEICDTLWQINSNNSKLEWRIINNEEYVLVGNFNKYPASYSDTSLINSWGIIWVFIPEQYKSRIKSSIIQDNDTLLRIRQLFGLSPSNANNYIVELWVKPEDLFRPSADPEIDDKTAGLYFPTNTDTNYIKWFNQNIYDSYFGNGTHYPWTRLGYTYDWAKPSSEVGVSEYCIKTNSLLFVKKLCLATKYLNN